MLLRISWKTGAQDSEALNEAHSLGAVGPRDLGHLAALSFHYGHCPSTSPQADHFQLCGLVISKTDLRHPKLSHYLRGGWRVAKSFLRQVNLKYFELKKNSLPLKSI